MFNTQIKKDIEKIKKDIEKIYIYSHRIGIENLFDRLKALEKFLNIEYKAKSEVPAHYEKKPSRSLIIR